jgi:predicted amidohydrolase
MKKPIVALAQINYFDSSKSNNLKKIKKYIKLAKQKNADIICFPESCIHKSVIPSLKHKYIKEIREECKKYSIWAIITEDIKHWFKIYNTALIIDRKGKIVGYYKKIHLFGDKTSAGKKPIVIKTDFGKIGIAVCWDLAFPELFKKMKKKGAQIIFCPSQWWYESKAHKKNHKKNEINLLRSMISARAFENLVFICLCNPVMEYEHQVSYSAIAEPHRILSEIAYKEGLITSELDLNLLKKYKKIYN